MRLNYTDVKWSEFRLTSEYARVLRATEVVTCNVFSFSDSAQLSAYDSCRIALIAPKYEFCSASDSVTLSYTARVKESVLLPELFSVQVSARLSEVSVPVEIISVTFRSPFSETALVSDSISCRFMLIVRDAIGYNESFFFGGHFNVDVNNVLFTSDAYRTQLDSPQPDVAAVAEFVRVGIRHMIDFYLGGFTIGSVVFGGRVR